MQLSIYLVITILISLPLHANNRADQDKKTHREVNHSQISLIKNYLYHPRYQFMTIAGLTALAAYLLYCAVKTNSANNNQEELQNNNDDQDSNSENSGGKTITRITNTQQNIIDNEEKIKTFQEYLNNAQEKITNYKNKVESLFNEIGKETKGKAGIETKNL